MMGANFWKKALGAFFARIFMLFAQIFRYFANIFIDFDQIFTNFQGFCPNFRQTKTFGGALARHCLYIYGLALLSAFR